MTDDFSLSSQVHLQSHFIMNGVCVRWKGRIDLDKLDGTGCLEFDEERAMVSVKYPLETITTRISPRARDPNAFTYYYYYVAFKLLRP